MTMIDWHAARCAGQAVLLERAPEWEATIDLAALRGYRQRRLRAEMAARDIAACVLFDPVNIRYACGARNMQVFHARNPARYLVLPVEGPVVLFEFAGCHHLAAGLETIQEIRPAITASFCAAGPAIAERERTWARRTAALLRELCPGESRIGLERVNAGTALALAAEGFSLVDAQEPVERARAIKGSEELSCIRASVAAVEAAVAAMRATLRPGLSENELWSVLHQGVIAQDADYVETRLLNSGPRTNPWFQEAGPRVIEPGELVALDTDVVGCHGYYCDFSRTFHSGGPRPSGAQRSLYATAREQVEHNLAIIRPGMTFRDYAEQAWSIPDRFFANRYFLSAHGCGMTGEYPYLYHRADFGAAGYDGVIEPGMTLCVESFIGEEGAGEGVKLEQQVLVTETGTELLSKFPFEDELS